METKNLAIPQSENWTQLTGIGDSVSFELDEYGSVIEYAVRPNATAPAVALRGHTALKTSTPYSVFNIGQGTVWVRSKNSATTITYT